MKEGAVIQPGVQQARRGRWLRWAVAAVGCVAVAVVAYLMVQQYRIRPAPHLRIEQVESVKIRTYRTQTLTPTSDRAAVLRILRAWNTSRIGPLKGDTTGDFYLTVLLRSGRSLDIWGWYDTRHVDAAIDGVLVDRFVRVYPSKELKAYILELGKDYEERIAG